MTLFRVRMAKPVVICSLCHPNIKKFRIFIKIVMVSDLRSLFRKMWASKLSNVSIIAFSDLLSLFRKDVLFVIFQFLRVDEQFKLAVCQDEMRLVLTYNVQCASSNHQKDRKSTRLNSSHANISYAVFCL